MLLPVDRKNNVLIYLKGIYSDRILFLIFATGVIGGIWLLLLSQFKLVISGIAFALIFRYVYKLLNFPIAKLSPFLVENIRERKKIWVVLLGFFVSCYDFIILAFWSFFIFKILLDTNPGASIAPLILWGYTVVMGGVEYMSSTAENYKKFGVSINFLYTQFIYFLIIGLWLLGFNPLWWVIFTLFFFSAITIREDLLLSKRKFKPDA